jgi:hypothetical protein
MNTQASPSKELSPFHDLSINMLWLLGAVTPAALIMLTAGHDMAHGGRIQPHPLMVFGLNPLTTFVSCYGLLHRRGGNKVTPIVGGVFLGLIFAVLNIYVGALSGCICDGQHGAL